MSENLLKSTPSQVFSCEFLEIFQSSYIIKSLQIDNFCKDLIDGRIR